MKKVSIIFFKFELNVVRQMETTTLGLSFCFIILPVFYLIVSFSDDLKKTNFNDLVVIKDSTFNYICFLVLHK